MSGPALIALASPALAPALPALAHASPADVPPPLTPARLLTTWSLEPLPLIAILVAGGLYLYAVRRLHARGDSWSPWRTLSFCLGGLGTMVLATSSVLAAYDTVKISVHNVKQKKLIMVVPVFLALGAPVTLALRVLPGRGRAAVLTVLHARLSRVLTFPVVAGAIFVANPFVLYFTPLYEATLRSPVLHDLNHLHFVLVGCLWFWPLLGLDPMPSRPPYPLRMLAAFVTLPFHAFLGVALMSASRPIAEDWYAGLARTWPPTLAQDQQWAGGLLWASGDLVGLLVFAAVAVQWMRDSEREATREDRRLDRLEASGTPAARAAPLREAGRS